MFGIFYFWIFTFQCAVKLLDLFAVFLALLVAYFVQNLTVFDMPASLMLFALVLSFIAFLASPKRPRPDAVKRVRAWVGILLLIVFLVTFFEFVIQPLKTDHFVIKSVTARAPDERLEYYKKTLEASPMGRYQIRDFFGQHTQDFVRKNLQTAPREILIRELDFVIKEMQKTVKATPIDYRANLKLAQIHNVYALLDVNKIALAEEYGKASLALAPNNQQSYWALAQTKVYQKDYESALQFAKTAVALEPEWLNSHKALVEVAIRAKQHDEAKEFAQEAVELMPDWEGEFDDILANIPEEPLE